jgi:hypothetical protein
MAEVRMVRVVNNKVERIWKETVMAQHWPGGSEEDHKRAESG